MPLRVSINDNTREEWVNNHAGLYFLFERTGGSMRKFVKDHRAVIDEVIKLELEKGATDRASYRQP